MNPDILIVNGLLKRPASKETAGDEPGFVAISGEKIVAIGTMAELPKGARPTRTIDAENCLVMPGLINTHNHCAMTLFRGLADDLPLISWLQDHIFPAEAKFVNEEMVYWCTRLAAAEMILSGTTTVADGYFHEDAAAWALKESGLRAITAQGVIDFPAPGVPDPANNIATAAEFIEQWQGDRLISPAIFCHSPYTCSEQTLKKAKALARQAGCRFFIHLAETAAEVEQSRQQHGVSPVDYLKQLDILDPETVCVHAVWLDENDIATIRTSGASVASCPESNMKLAAGIAPLDRYVEEGIPVGLGTDGCASNNNLDMFGEMAAAAKIHKINRQDPTILPAAEVFRMATTGGAEVLGLQDETGRLETGMQADIIIVDLRSPHLTPIYDQDSLLAYAASGSDVKTSIIAGKMVMADRQLLTIELDEVLARVNSLAEQVRSAT
jgi:5-methylthioadenosine/S-adenosylhomocysteine deaminase